MISRSSLLPRFDIHQANFQCSLLSRQLLPKSHLFERSSSGQSLGTTGFSLLNHRDWLSPPEAVKIFQSLKDPSLTLTLLDQISKRKDYKPNEALFTAVFHKLALVKNFDDIENLMERLKLERSFRVSDAFFYNVIKIYGHSAGRVNKAVETLFEMPDYKCWPTVKTFNFVLNLLVCTRKFDVIHEVYRAAPKLCVETDVCTLNIIIRALCLCGKVDAAFNVLDEFPKQNFKPNARTFSTIMHGLCSHGRVDEAFGLLERMEKEGVDPDSITYNILISGLRNQGRFEEGLEVFKRIMLKGNHPDPATYQEVLYILIDAKQFVEAKEFMGMMLNMGVNPSFESYKSVIHGLCNQNLMEDVEWALNQMVWNGFIPKMGMWKRVVQCLFPN